MHSSHFHQNNFWVFDYFLYLILYFLIKYSIKDLIDTIIRKDKNFILLSILYTDSCHYRHRHKNNKINLLTNELIIDNYHCNCLFTNC